MDIRLFIDQLEKGKSQYLNLKNAAIVKIIKITVDDEESDAFYEVMVTEEQQKNCNQDQLKFIYRRLINFAELEEFLNENSFEKN